MITSAPQSPSSIAVIGAAWTRAQVQDSQPGERAGRLPGNIRLFARMNVVIGKGFAGRDRHALPPCLLLASDKSENDAAAPVRHVCGIK